MTGPAETPDEETVPQHRTRLLGAVTLGLSLALTTAACGDDARTDTSTAASTTEHHDADVAFATDMIQHHAQAMAMVNLTVGRPLDPEVQQLAEDIRAAQTPEIETMVDWLDEWGEDVPETMNDHGNAGHDGGHMSDSMQGMDLDMPGMMSAEEMDALQDASDAEFQDMWLDMMTRHHAGAVEMARTELENGRHPAALDLAESIVKSQTAEIEKMQRLLD